MDPAGSCVFPHGSTCHFCRPAREKAASAKEFAAGLAAVIGSGPSSRTEWNKQFWDYIRTPKPQDSAKKTQLNADDKLRAGFDGEARVSMFRMTKLVSSHVK